MNSLEVPDEEGVKQRSLWPQRIASGLLLAVSLSVLFTAENLVSKSTFARSGDFPAHGALLLGSGILAAASLVWLVSSVRGKQATVESDSPEEALPPITVVLTVFGILIAASLLVPWLGLLGAAVATYVALLLFYRDFNWLYIVISSTVFVLIIHFGLVELLRVQIPSSPFLPTPF